MAEEGGRIMNQFKKGDRVIAEALMKEHPLCFCGKFIGIVVDDLPEIEHIEHGIPYQVHIDGHPKGKTYPFLAAEMKKLGSAEEEKEDSTTKQDDVISHPSHYTQGKIEVIDFIEDQKLNYHLGNCVKYICRCFVKHKDKPSEDLKKARWYLNREIKELEKDGR